MLEPTDDNLSNWRSVLWDVSIERRVHGRHSETLRANVTNYVLIAASGLVALITFDRVLNRHDLALSLLLVAVGVLGTLFNASYTERYHRNRRRASELLKELDRLAAVDGHRTLAEIEKRADEIHFQRDRFRRIYRLASTHWLWLAFPVAVAIIGLVVSALSIVGWADASQ